MLQDILNRLSVGTLVEDEAGTLRFANLRAKEILAATDDSEDWKHRPMRLLLDALESPEEGDRRLAQLRADTVPKEGEIFRLADGRTLELSYQPLNGQPLGSDLPSGHLWQIWDISSRLVVERRLRLSEAQYRKIFAEGPLAISLVDPEDLSYIEVNARMSEFLGYTDDELLGMTSLEVTHPDDVHNDSELAREAFEGRRRFYQIYKRFIRRNGDVVWGHLTASVISDRSGKALYTINLIEDVTERKQAEVQIQRLAFYDELTQLPNRRLLQDRLEQTLNRSLRSGQLGAMLLLDLDHFKTVNDSLGHRVGDALLQKVAERLRSCLRQEDTVARLGGDEFVVLLPDLGDRPEKAAQRAQLVAEKVQATLTEPFSCLDHELPVTASIGICLFPEPGNRAEEILTHADAAMYRAKEEGRDTSRLFLPSMQASAQRRLRLEQDLRRALERRELELYYQPQLDLTSGQIIGAEALLRWLHPKRGIVMPATFIPVAEESGLIRSLGEWVLRTACTQLKGWINAEDGPYLQRLAVNISPRQFHGLRFVEQVTQILEETGVSPHHLELELTEGPMTADAEETSSRMQALSDLGVRLSVDDFGTGYSSLAYLKRLPLDSLKIDKSFVQDITTDPNDAAIVETIIAIAHLLGLEVIAEGVEKEAELHFLRSRGCWAYQGYYFSKPVPARAFTALVQEHRRALSTS